MRFYVLWYYIYINDQSYELNKINNKDVLWFFIKLVLQKITKTHDNVCCALTPRYNLLQEKTITWTKEALHIYYKRAMMARGRLPKYHWNQIISKSVHRFSRSPFQLFLFIALGAILLNRVELFEQFL